MHSRCSDGSLEPHELVQRAHEQQVQLLALTDHDTTAGLQEARNTAAALGVDFIEGIELSACWGKLGVHIVGLGFDPAHPAMIEIVADQQRRRRERNEQIAARLAKLGVADAYARACALAGAEPGRPHFAALMVEDGKVPDVGRAFKKYLGSGKGCDVKQVWPDIGVVIRAINASGGAAVLAHPAKYKLTRTKLRALVSDFSAAGGEAIEVVSGMQPAGVAENLATIAAEFELQVSVGSDFHKPGMPWQELGCVTHLPAGVAPLWHRWTECL
nr:PHP domain-containing protein [Gilvimarinus xylanilyticus]